MLFTLLVILLLVLALVSGVQSEFESKLDATSHGCVLTLCPQAMLSPRNYTKALSRHAQYTPLIITMKRQCTCNGHRNRMEHAKESVSDLRLIYRGG